jgi:EAL domain-containing protein (putative c-di-GMP-specific phosphodiesterase class I)
MKKGPSEDIERLRQERLLVDAVTGLPLRTPWDFRRDRVAQLGIVYLQLGRCGASESVYGWELYDGILRLSVASLKEDLESSALKARLLTMLFNGCDGFYLLFDLTNAGAAGRAVELGAEASRLKKGLARRVRQSFVGSPVSLLNVYATTHTLADDSRVRPSRNLMRGLAEAVRSVEVHESETRHGLIKELKSVLSGRKLRVVYQRVVDIQTGAVLGHEALIRGPAGSALESPDALFDAARAGDVTLELESLCLETIFGSVGAAVRRGALFVNASARLLTHSVFLDERNLAEIRRAHPSVVLEISEKEIVGSYSAFREVLESLRAAGLSIAIDDAGSGYSGLESILQIRPEYIKVASSLVFGLHDDRIKREIISALASVGRQTGAAVVAEGIESAEDLQALVALGIRYGQGFLLGRPSGRVSAPARDAGRRGARANPAVGTSRPAGKIKTAYDAAG